MTIHHYTEEALQQFAMEGITADQQMTEHLEQCPACRAVVEEYRLLFTEIQQLSKPSFEVDLSALVLQQLPVSKRSKTFRKPLIAAIAAIIVFLAALPLLLYEYQLTSYLNGLSIMVLGAIIIVALIITILHVHDSFLRYSRKMQMLN